MKILYILLFLVISCSSKPKISVNVDNRKSNSIIKSELKKMNIKNKTPIEFSKVNDKYVAICKQYKVSSLNVVYINKKIWNTLSQAQKKLTLLHELGHCDKNLEHDNSLQKDGCPVSIMHSKLFSSNCFIKHEKTYLKQVGYL